MCQICEDETLFVARLSVSYVVFIRIESNSDHNLVKLLENEITTKCFKMLTEMYKNLFLI